MLSPEARRERRLRREAARIERQYGVRGMFTRNKATDYRMILQQASLRNPKPNDLTQLRIQSATHGAAAGDVDGFWFIPGYSYVGGPDVVYVP